MSFTIENTLKRFCAYRKLPSFESFLDAFVNKHNVNLLNFTIRKFAECWLEKNSDLCSDPLTDCCNLQTLIFDYRKADAINAKDLATLISVLEKACEKLDEYAVFERGLDHNVRYFCMNFTPQEDLLKPTAEEAFTDDSVLTTIRTLNNDHGYDFDNFPSLLEGDTCEDLSEVKIKNLTYYSWLYKRFDESSKEAGTKCIAAFGENYEKQLNTYRTKMCYEILQSDAWAN